MKIWKIDFFSCDQKSYNDCDIDYEVSKQVSIKKRLGCDFKRSNQEDPEFDIFKVTKKVHCQRERDLMKKYNELKDNIKKGTKKRLKIDYLFQVYFPKKT